MAKNNKAEKLFRPSLTLENKTTRRDSITSSRGTSFDDEFKNQDISKSKALYDSQVSYDRDRNSTESMVSTLPVSKQRKGLEISFLVSEASLADVQKQAKFMPHLQHLTDPDNINLEAVRFGLIAKNTTRQHSSVEMSLQTFSELRLSCENAQDKVTFKGEIKAFEKCYIDNERYFTTPDHRVSLMATKANSDISDNDDFVLWPWLDAEAHAFQLYRNTAKLDNSFSNQLKTLPKLKCPSLTHTLNRYVESVQPCVSIAQFQQTQSVVKRFADNIGKTLQADLDRFAESEEGWISRTLPNYHYCYSIQEAPLINLGIIAPFVHDVWPEKEDSMLERAAVIVRLATEFWNLIRTESLKPIGDGKGRFINMQQFLELFSSTTLPGVPKVHKCCLMTPDSVGDTARHIVIAYRGNLFTMNVVGRDYQPLLLSDISNSIRGLMAYVDLGYNEPQDGITILTASHDGIWFDERSRLEELGSNKSYFSEIDHSLFVLSLDHMNVKSLDQLANEAMFGDGCNRWYDKGLNFYVYKNGFVTLNINSKILDGSTVAYLLHYMQVRIQEESQMWEDEEVKPELRWNAAGGRKSLAHLIKAESLESLKPNDLGYAVQVALTKSDLKLLEFTLDERAHENIYKHASVFKALSTSLLSSTCKLDAFNTIFFSDRSMNKDVFAHMALHLTFFRMYFRPASMAHRTVVKQFANARYDTTRLTTKQAAAWCRACLDPSIDKQTKNVLFWDAHDVNMKLLKECYGGNGCENHLNALRNLADDCNIPAENNLFEDDGFFAAGGGDRYDVLTESLGSGCTSCPVLPPSNPKGYGIGYSVAKSFILFTVTSWEEERTACAPLFASSLKQTCLEMISTIGCKQPRRIHTL